VRGRRARTTRRGRSRSGPSAATSEIHWAKVCTPRSASGAAVSAPSRNALPSLLGSGTARTGPVPAAAWACRGRVDRRAVDGAGRHPLHAQAAGRGVAGVGPAPGSPLGSNPRAGTGSARRHDSTDDEQHNADEDGGAEAPGQRDGIAVVVADAGGYRHGGHGERARRSGDGVVTPAATPAKCFGAESSTVAVSGATVRVRRRRTGPPGEHAEQVGGVGSDAEHQHEPGGREQRADGQWDAWPDPGGERAAAGDSSISTVSGSRAAPASSGLKPATTCRCSTCCSTRWPSGASSGTARRCPCCTLPSRWSRSTRTWRRPTARWCSRRAWPRTSCGTTGGAGCCSTGSSRLPAGGAP
jgi:hypothetical protein